ncbi:MAG: alpha-galactosidase [Clostridia bacterium]|nr:alpha-galactosidase [Clostridia bacterium]
MSFFYDEKYRSFYLSGGDVSYVMHVDDEGELENLYWGKRIPDGSVVPEMNRYYAVASFDRGDYRRPHELPVRGTGWYGTPAVDVINARGNDVVTLRYVSYTVYASKKPLPGMPAVYTETDNEADSLEILLEDPLTGLRVTSVYTVFNESGVITRHLSLENAGSEVLTVRGAMAASVPLYGNGYDLVHLKGSWARERSVIRVPQGEGEYRIFSQRGASGHEENPFLALCRKNTDEFSGEVWAMNFVYSGSFLALSFVDNAGNTRMSVGMDPATFTWRLEQGETFCTPEAVLVWSEKGFNGMSRTFHRLYRRRLCRGYWRDRPRPVLINNWEATYFGFTEEKLLAIAERAKQIGTELFVLDDGWFGRRDRDDNSLGDWVENRNKLPCGIKGLAEKINAIGLKFGLWFEPEMVSPDSDLYRAHPDWCLHVDGRPRTECRQQLILDMSRTEVQDYIIDAVGKVLSGANIEYVKWDMNRNMTEAFSGDRVPERQLETQHRYILGVYRVMDILTTRFPNILFEGCSGGGGRFDPGILYYMPQFWTSDDTDAVERLKIQYGTSFVYPPSAISAHVSAVPNHQTGRSTGMQMRGDVAVGGNFGFELDLSALSDDDITVARQLVTRVKQVRSLVQQGDYYRLLSPFEGNYTAWQFVSEDRGEVLLCAYVTLVTPNTVPIRIRLQGLDPDAVYRDESGREYAGAVLMNMGFWMQLKQDFTSSVIHLIKV